ncbi:uncharacterized protein LOC135371289 [Ornithodoros turicata]|uniref:uncharacterized protein LOC135371289 n=1 Tax=Ornithodoros turicata TaxID=34597 RepID=UPI003139795E
MESSQGSLLSSRMLSYSPPQKVQLNLTAKKECLVLQPFSSAPQLIFRDVLPGREAKQTLEIRNTSDIDHAVIMDKIPVGFSADSKALVVPSGSSKGVVFTWAPTVKSTSCRYAVNVRSEQGYRGSIFLLGTVKSVQTRPTKAVKTVKKTQPPGKILTSSQKLNIKAEKTTPKATTKSGRLLTMPVEFKCAQRRNDKSKMKHSVTSKASEPNQPKRQTVTIIPKSGPMTKPASQPSEAPVHSSSNTLTCKSEIEHSVMSEASGPNQPKRQTVTITSKNGPTSKPASQLSEAPVHSSSLQCNTLTRQSAMGIQATPTLICELEDSLDGSVPELPLRRVTLSSTSAKKDAADIQHKGHQISAPASPADLDFSGRMEELYRRLLREGKVEGDASIIGASHQSEEPTTPDSEFAPAAAKEQPSEGLVAVEELKGPEFHTPGQCHTAGEPNTEASSNLSVSNVCGLTQKFAYGLSIGETIYEVTEETPLMKTNDERNESFTNGCIATDGFPSDISIIHDTVTTEVAGGKPNC